LLRGCAVWAALICSGSQVFCKQLHASGWRSGWHLGVHRHQEHHRDAHQRRAGVRVRAPWWPTLRPALRSQLLLLSAARPVPPATACLSPTCLARRPARSSSLKSTRASTRCRSAR
jgi:hypothetical protein